MCAISVIVDVGFGWADLKRETSVIDVVSIRTFLINKHYKGIQSNKICLIWRLIWIFNIYIKPYISATLLIGILLYLLLSIIFYDNIFLYWSNLVNIGLMTVLYFHACTDLFGKFKKQKICWNYFYCSLWRCFS